ncbi:MAG: hypothetical protein RLZZ537_196 [Pseudomonadota bacterium]
MAWPTQEPTCRGCACLGSLDATTWDPAPACPFRIGSGTRCGTDETFRSVTVSLTLGNTDDLHYAGMTRLQQKVEAADFIICVGVAARTALMRLTPHRYWHKYDACAPGVDTLRFQP